ncbi:hypothetical protein FOZ62_006810 [Perkinsus olseni]|uniref:Uncharacterized protein n=1 Tax=Perkinsus olseni TaxID=32597 RepID=A0A7J6P4V6_PEROL|nr:hypothetical protein FOZ62_006810 [Perkinsus olseni]
MRNIFRISKPQKSLTVSACGVSHKSFSPKILKFSVPSELDLLKAIVELLGTPSEQTWPEASSLPSFHEFAYLPEPDNWPREMFGDACKESEKLDEFLKSMLMLNPSARPSSADLLEHDYFTSGHPSMASKEELAKALRPAVDG